MFTNIAFTLEAGKFGYNWNRQSDLESELSFAEPTLRIPLTNNTLIGRALSAGSDEQTLCDGGVIDYFGIFEGELGKSPVKGSVRFIERPSYNGQKVIIPIDQFSVNNNIAVEQGLLGFTKQKNNKYSIAYVHRAEDIETRIWSPNEGLTDILSCADKAVDLNLTGKISRKYLLLGGKPDAKTLEQAFLVPSYYVCVLREDV